MRRIVCTVAVMVASLGMVAPAVAQTAPDPVVVKGVEQQLVVQVPERAAPPVTVTIGAGEPVVSPAPAAGSLPRTGVGPWFGPTLLAALLLLVGGLGLRSLARRLDPQRMAWPQYGQVT